MYVCMYVTNGMIQVAIVPYNLLMVVRRVVIESSSGTAFSAAVTSRKQKLCGTVARHFR